MIFNLLLFINKITKLVKDLRVIVNIEIVENVVQQTPFYNLIKKYSKITN